MLFASINSDKWFIYWLPVIYTYYYHKSDGFQNKFSAKKHAYKGAVLRIRFAFFIWTLEIDYWFKVELR